MKWRDFFEEYIWFLFGYIFLIFFFVLFLVAFHIEWEFVGLFIILFGGFGFFTFFSLSLRRKRFYDTFFQVLEHLEQKYLITEMDLKPNFLDARKFFEALLDIDKSMKEHIGLLEQKNNGFREYLEMWIHEVKLPLSNLQLMLHNQHFDENKMRIQMTQMENLVEQVLFYVRSETLDKDYLIKKTSLGKVIKEVVRKNKDAFILGKVKIDVLEVCGYVLTDQKWLGFIVNQILSNSIKYRKTKDSEIKIYSVLENNQVKLKIWDNGIGICEADIPRVFDKSFTGVNGRVISNSTGMGLYIVKNLVQKLGHQITIASKSGEYTEVTILFSLHDFYDVVN